LEGLPKRGEDLKGIPFFIKEIPGLYQQISTKRVNSRPLLLKDFLYLIVLGNTVRVIPSIP
jgi:hypothetical protein